MTRNEWHGHGAMLVAEIMWGLMAPVAKLVLSGAVTPLLLTDCRLLGAALLFWTTSLFTRKEPVHHKDMLRLFFASLLGVVFNQGMFLFGLGHTSPINASVITTSLPILTMIISALYLREPVTGKKLQGVFLGALGALLLILSGRQGGSTDGSMLGDLLCLLAQLSFSCYLVFFKGLTGRYSPVTLMKWIFTYASICVIPFSYGEILAVEWSRIDPMSLAGVLTVVFCGTYISYLLVPVGQRYLRPTVTSMYNYVQPIVASCVAVWWGLDSFNLLKGAAVVLVFTGVFFVTKSRSRADLEAAGEEV